MDHDPWCPATVYRGHLENADCLCDLIGQVGERIAVAIEAEGHPLSCSSRWQPVACNCAVGRHAQIARNGGSDD